ncbi:MAG: 2-oxoacid:acceptor oxidoreductase family protein [Candidatus Aenigmarchaeota archaeon]|nr:2-oxoacid:acceptor oxidoreductase family protein [Candidatus Aenigmarchaeota archaeon]
MSAHILGRGAFLSGFKIQDFAVYGAERRGAPLSSFCRISKEDIGTRGYIFNPDNVVSLDRSIGMDTILSGAKKGAIVLVNSDKKIPKIKEFKIHHIDATSIALEIIGKPIPNVAILGAFLRLTKMFPLKNLEAAIGSELEEAGHGGMADSNIRACRVCYRKIGEK